MSELIFPVINFAGLIALLVYFVRKPLKEMVQTRHRDLKNKIEGAEDERLRAEKALQDLEEKLKQLGYEAETMLTKARQDADVMKHDIIQAAEKSAQRIIRDAEESAQASWDDYRDQVRREIIKRSVEMAEALVTKRLSADDQRRFVTEYVERVQVQ